MGHDIIVQMASKKQGSASAGSPIDFVSVAGLVKVPKSIISGDEFTRIDLGG